MHTNTVTIAQTVLDILNVDHTVTAQGWTGEITTDHGFSLWTVDSSADINVRFLDAAGLETGSIRIAGTPQVIEAMLATVIRGQFA